MTNRTETLALITELEAASKAYYNNETVVPLTDEEFDAKLLLLEAYAADPELSDLFEEDTTGWKLLENDVNLGAEIIIPNDKKVHHESPMLSLGKAKNRTDLMKFIEKARIAGVESFCLQAKLDGNAMSAQYDDGKLVLLASRGTGTVGENLTNALNEKNLKIVGLPRNIKHDEHVEVRGEIMFTDAQYFAADAKRFALTGEHFANQRNGASGVLRSSAKNGVDYTAELTFYVYSVIINNKPVNLSEIADEDFITVSDITKEKAPNVTLEGLKTDEEIFDAVTAFGEARKTFDILTDGVVIKPTNEAEMLTKMGATSHHPASQLAFKYPGEAKESTVLEIIVGVGKTGKLTPVARTIPTHVEGSVLEYFTLNNFNYIRHQRNLEVRVGSKVMVHKANGTIPEIASVLANPAHTVQVEVPTNCPSCDSVLYYDKNRGEYPPKTLRCLNEECASRDIYALYGAVKKDVLDIERLAEATLDALFECGRIKHVGDLFTLTMEEIADAKKVAEDGTSKRTGEKNARFIMDRIEAAKSHPLHRILKSLNILHLGNTTGKALAKKFGTIEAIQNATVEEISNIDKLGKIRAESIVNGLAMRKHIIDTMRDNGVLFGVVEDATTTSDENSVSLEGISFAISGEVPQPFNNRGSWVEYIESKGGSFHSSPKATTTYMIGDAEGTSSKLVKAKTLGVAFLTATEFTEKFVN